MSTFKIAKVVMLPTNEVKGDFSKERIYPRLLKHSWMFDKEGKGKLIFTNSNIRTPTQLQNLYIILDKKPDNGDYYIIDGISEVLKNNGLKFIDDNCKKIIATTDSSLEINSNFDYNQLLPNKNNFRFYLPQPSQQFIEKYIEEYNKGNMITDVLVEYTFNDFKFMATLCTTKEKEYILKINPKNNTITIKKAKDSWTREEVIELCRQAFIDGTYAGGFGPNEKTIDSETEKWIEENL